MSILTKKTKLDLSDFFIDYLNQRISLEDLIKIFKPFLIGKNEIKDNILYLIDENVVIGLKQHRYYGNFKAIDIYYSRFPNRWDMITGFEIIKHPGKKYEQYACHFESDYAYEYKAFVVIPKEELKNFHNKLNRSCLY